MRDELEAVVALAAALAEAGVPAREASGKAHSRSEFVHGPHLGSIRRRWNTILKLILSGWTHSARRTSCAGCGRSGCAVVSTTATIAATLTSQYSCADRDPGAFECAS